MITRLHHVQITIPERAEAEARMFYCGVLGLPEVPKPAALAGRGGFWVQAGEQQVHIGTDTSAGRAATKAHTAYEVNDLEEWRERLASVGISAEDGVPIPGFARFEFSDPFGNRVEFIQPLVPMT